MESLNAESLGFVEDLWARYQEDPTSVDPAWRRYFDELPPAPSANGGRVGIGPAFSPSSIFNPPAAAALPPPTSLAPVAAPGAPAPAERLPFLKSLRLLQGVSDEEVEELAKLSTEVEAADGQYVFRQGQTADALYIVMAGSVVILRDEQITVELGPGEVVGELAVLDHEPRIADAIARGKVRLLRLGASELIARVEKSPALARGVIRGLTRRLRVRGTQQHRVDQLVRAYRVRGHLLADLNPLAKPSLRVPELELAHWGLSEADLDTLFSSATIPGTLVLKLREIVERMQESYCGSIGLQYMHLNSLERKLWLQQRIEDPQVWRKLSVKEQRRILTKLTDAEIFEQFVHKKFLGAKRFSLEGAETLIPLLDLVIDEAAGKGCKEIVFGMAHRGRLNVLANLMHKSPAQIFA
ncbi:MAG: cyclic nucleotide-binding domain-containing protein, partial [Acidobacteria bacterium]|nr:cyclic nucleotide-binding domain-containing protein [Acidobacteriota bacterium]